MQLHVDLFACHRRRPYVRVLVVADTDLLVRLVMCLVALHLHAHLAETHVALQEQTAWIGGDDLVGMVDRLAADVSNDSSACQQLADVVCV